ncbi:MAG: sigma-70 family RNA polymerase sigma factor [Cytophagales bacterium]|nr:sigma-70 family RNA polymerase sigma factor [Armatimonadota bacterium]
MRYHQDGPRDHDPLNAGRTAPDMSCYRPVLLRLALSLTRNAEDAEDLVQDTLLRAMRRAETFRAERGGDSALPWLVAIQRNVFLNQYHRRRRQGENQRIAWSEVEEATEGKSGHDPRLSNPPEQALLLRSQAVRILALWEQLPTAYRYTLSLLVFEQLTYEEISQRLGLPLGTVRSRLHRARERLARALSA